MFVLVFSLFFGILQTFHGQAFTAQSNIIQQNNMRVRNLNTDRNYSTIQEAIDAPETLDGHEIFVASGIYYEHVTVDKSLFLIGEERSSTIIDGNGKDKVVYVTADNVEVRNFTIRNGTFGLWLHNSQNSKIINNTLQKGAYGIRVYNSRNSKITGNNVQGYTFFGVEIKSSGNSTLRDNIIADNKYNFGVNGDSLLDFLNNIDTSNTVNGNPIYYLNNQQNIRIDSFTFRDIGYLGIINSSNVQVENLNVQDNIEGILFAFTTNSTISNVRAESNWNGIYVAHSTDILASGNIANSNFDYGIKFFNSSRSIAGDNNVDRNGWAGIGLFRSPNSTVEGNEASFNTYDLHIVYTNNSVIARNNALVKPGSYSIALYYSHNNHIYHNTFANSLLYKETRNKTQYTPRNNWDNGLEGNFWTLNRGVDTDQDGISDHPYIVGENNVDNHPLMGKFSEFTVTLEEKTYSINIISNSTISQFQFSFAEGRVSFIASGENGTIGFSRITVSHAFLQGLHGGNLSFLINGEEPVLRRKWTNDTHTFFYFSYVNSVLESVISPWLVVGLVVIFVVGSLVAFWVLRRKVRMFRRDSDERVQLG